jgi:hypothetical protein
MDTPKSHLHDRHATDTSAKSGGVKLVLWAETNSGWSNAASKYFPI